MHGGPENLGCSTVAGARVHTLDVFVEWMNRKAADERGGKMNSSACSKAWHGNPATGPFASTTSQMPGQDWDDYGEIFCWKLLNGSRKR